MARGNMSPSERVVMAVADACDTDPLDLPQLYGVIDPDALDALVHDLPGGEVCFRYVGYIVTVESNGSVRIDGRPIAGDFAGEGTSGTTG
jgi:hypothetical protein